MSAAAKHKRDYIATKPNILHMLIANEAYRDKIYEGDESIVDDDLRFKTRRNSITWMGVLCNPNISMKFIEESERNGKRINWSTVAQNPNLTIDFIERNPDKDWPWWLLSRHPEITWEFIKQNPDKRWSWRLISYNPNITIDII